MRALFLALVLFGSAFTTGAVAENLNQDAGEDTSDLYTLEGKRQQGGMMVGKTTPGATVVFNDRKLKVTDNGHFIFGFGRDFEGDAKLSVTVGEESATENIDVAKRSYDIQRIDGLPPKMVTPPKEVLERIKREGAMIAKVRALNTDGNWFANDFAWPATGRISGVFGSQRILNGEPRRPHFGIDVAAPTGTPVYEAVGGIVALAENDLYYTGGTVMVDHGHGLTGVYMHLDSVAVEVGQVLKQGDPVGTVGSTGRSTGPHLDWRLNWFNERLDPAFLVGPMATPSKKEAAQAE